MNTTQSPRVLPLEQYFEPFRKNIIGIDQEFDSPFGKKKILYADWTASGRLYAPIEKKIAEDFGPFVGNTHTETSVTGTAMTMAYHEAKHIIKKHVNADDNDCIIVFGSGMTGVINKFQRILGLRIPEQYRGKISIPEEDRPIVFITHMEHHSNQTSWLETIVDVEVINPDSRGLVDVKHFEERVEKYKNRKLKIASVTACSNVTGIEAPYRKIASVIHRHGGVCLVDFACSAPYVTINMHPEHQDEYLDAIFFSPHKFLGGPGTPGVMVFNSALYHNRVPDHPGGGTVKWTNPWKEHEYIDDIEEREDGGTPAFLQTIKAALAVRLKEKMGIDKMLERESEILQLLLKPLKNIPNLHLLAGNVELRLGILSFYIDDLHYNLGVRLLNDLFGIQVRGGCSCAGTYGHYLLEVTYESSQAITSEIHKGNLSVKPGWIRLSVHPTVTNAEVNYLAGSLEHLAANFKKYEPMYRYNKNTNEFDFIKNEKQDTLPVEIKKWFNF